MSRWIYYNPNPKGRETGDCAIRALCKATGKDWDRVYTTVSALGFAEKEMPSANSIWGEFLEAEGFTRHKIGDHFPNDFTVREFCINYPRGIYVLGLRGHVVTVVDGKYFDIWDSGERVVEYYWTREESHGTVH